MGSTDVDDAPPCGAGHDKRPALLDRLLRVDASAAQMALTLLCTPLWLLLLPMIYSVGADSVSPATHLLTRPMSRVMM